MAASGPDYLTRRRKAAPDRAAVAAVMESALDEGSVARVIEHLWPQHHDHLCRYADRILQNRHDAEDAAVGAREALSIYLGRGRPIPDNPGAWLKTVAIRRALDIQKGRPPWATGLDPDAVPAEEDPSLRAVFAKDTLTRLLAASRDKLTDTDRAVVALMADGYPNAYIAQILNMSANTLSKKRHRIFTVLKHSLAGNGTTPPSSGFPHHQLKGENDHAYPGT